MTDDQTPAEELRARAIEAGADAMVPHMRWTGEWLQLPSQTAIIGMQAREIVEIAHDAIAPLIRRQVAEEIARAIEAKKPSASRFWDSADAAHVYAYNDAAKVAREIGERHA
jgi:hypothetical protein